MNWHLSPVRAPYRPEQRVSLTVISEAASSPSSPHRGGDGSAYLGKSREPPPFHSLAASFFKLKRGANFFFLFKNWLGYV